MLFHAYLAKPYGFSRIFAQNIHLAVLFTLGFFILSTVLIYTTRNYQDLYAKYTCEECGPFKYRREAKRVPGDDIWFSDYIRTESDKHGYTVEDFE